MKKDQHIIDRLRANVNQHIDQFVKNYDEKGIKLLEIAPDEHLCAKAICELAYVQTLNINDTCDIQADITRYIPKPTNYYDAIICCEVLEHTSNPFWAVDELRRVLKHDGKLYITTPFNFRIHNPLPDNWRFTEHGLKELLKAFRQVEIEPSDTTLSPLHYRAIATK